MIPSDDVQDGVEPNTLSRSLDVLCRFPERHAEEDVMEYDRRDEDETEDGRCGVGEAGRRLVVVLEQDGWIVAQVSFC